MRMYEAFNQTWFSRFLNSQAGRVFRFLAGLGFLGAGLMYRDHVLGLAALAWSTLPLSAAVLDICYISAALGGPLKGAEIRAAQHRTVVVRANPAR
jgi:hypothetical protein